ncbi:MAG: cytochrome c oxidase subunit II [Planctomycetota bacterium]
MTLASISDFFAWFSGPWMPEDAGGFSGNVDALNGFILVVSYFFSILIAGLMVFFAIKYRQKDKSEVGEGKTHSTPIEIAWTLPPLLIVLVIFAVGFRGYLDMSTPAQAGNAYEIRAEAKMWGWAFYYPNGGVSQDLYVPANRPTKLTLESADVIHSLFIPAFRAKKDVVPGRFNTMWFEPDPSVVSEEKPQAAFVLNCTEYCGQGHSQMNAECIVVHPSEWENVLVEIKKFNPDNLPPVELGADIYKNKGGCAACHSVDGSSNTGPTWLNLYGSQRQLAVTDTGETVVTADAAYLNESIRYPNRKKAVGYANGNMSAYGEAQLSAGDVAALIAYMKTLTDQYKDEALQEFPEGYDGSVPVEEFVPAEGEAPNEGEAPAEAA